MLKKRRPCCTFSNESLLSGMDIGHWTWDIGELSFDPGDVLGHFVDFG